MAVITDIKRQKRNEQLYSVYIDGQYSFSLSDLDLSNSRLRSGQEVTPADLEQWQQVSLEAKAYNQAVGYISYRRRSRREVEIYLLRKDYSPDLVAGVLDRLSQIGLINDKVFAEAWIADRRTMRPRSRRRLAQELAAKGLEREVIDEVLAQAADDPVDTVIELVRRRRLQTKYSDQQKLIAYLGGQGFGYSEIKEALARLSEES
jgi:regulatory protein